MRTINEITIKAIGCAAIVFSSCYFAGYVKDNEYPTKKPISVEYFKAGQILVPDMVCPDTLIVRNAAGLNTAFAPIEQGFSGEDFGDSQYDSLFHVYCDIYKGSFEEGIKNNIALNVNE